MNIGSHDTSTSVFVIAEVGNNHEGDLNVAQRMIAAAARTGVHAVKFQTLRAASLVRPEDKQRYQTLQQFELSIDDYRVLARTAADEGVRFMSTPFDLEACDALDPLVPAFKIASGDNTFFPLLERAAALGKPILLSTGLIGRVDLRFAVASIDRVWARIGAPDQLALLHCVTSYPTAPADANLQRIDVLRHEFGRVVGYSDHTLGNAAAVAAVAMGARIIEKHFTLDKSRTTFRDHQLSADPADMSDLVQRVKEADVLRGTGAWTPSAAEEGARVAARRSLATRADLPAGHRLQVSDLAWLRPGGGFAPGRELEIVGRVLTRAVPRGTTIVPEMFE